MKKDRQIEFVELSTKMQKEHSFFSEIQSEKFPKVKKTWTLEVTCYQQNPGISYKDF